MTTIPDISPGELILWLAIVTLFIIDSFISKPPKE